MTATGVRKAAAEVKDFLDLRTVVLLGLAVVIAPFDITQLLCLALGAAGYMFVQSLRPTIKRPAPKYVAPRGRVQDHSGKLRAPSLPAQPRLSGGRTAGTKTPTEAASPKPPPARTASVMPVVAPSFQASGWEAEVQELLGHLLPTTDSDAQVACVVRSVQRTLAPAWPGIKVAGFASASLKSGAAFAVAVPELEVVVSMDPLLTQGHDQAQQQQQQQQLKATLRAMTDRLVNRAGFKFRRSAFRQEAPSVTMLAPAGFGEDDATPLSLSVHSTTPPRGAALLEECRRRAPQARDLILLVRRWAKDRGLSQVAAGHLPPYAWTLLVVYFLQVGVETGTVLPPVSAFDLFERLSGARDANSENVSTMTPSSPSAPVLLKAFFRFFAHEFDWQQELVCPRRGVRSTAARASAAPLAAGSSSQEAKQPCVEIEDPFDRTKNWGGGMTAQSLARLREELRRATDLTSEGFSLTLLLEPWAPAGVDKGAAE